MLKSSLIFTIPELAVFVKLLVKINRFLMSENPKASKKK